MPQDFAKHNHLRSMNKSIHRFIICGSYIKLMLQLSLFQWNRKVGRGSFRKRNGTLLKMYEDKLLLASFPLNTRTFDVSESMITRYLFTTCVLARSRKAEMKEETKNRRVHRVLFDTIRSDQRIKGKSKWGEDICLSNHGNNSHLFYYYWKHPNVPNFNDFKRINFINI